MIHASLFLRRALQADAIFSGVGALLMTFGSGELAPLLDLPEALLRETGPTPRWSAGSARDSPSRRRWS
jgi:hypothetical protein